LLLISKKTARAFLHKTFIATRYSSMPDLLNGLEAIQLDPVAVIERNHHLTASLRMKRYNPAELEQLLEKQQAFEYYAQAACLLPIADFPLFEDVRQRLLTACASDLTAHKDAIRVIFNRLATEGPLASNAFQSERKVIGGWDTNSASTKETSHALQLLFLTGQIQVVKRQGAKRFFALTEDAIPNHYLKSPLSTQERTRALLLKYARAYRLFSADDPRYGWQKHRAATRKKWHAQLVEEGVLTEVAIEGVKRPYAVLSTDVDELLSLNDNQPKGIAFLSPLDPLLWRRERLQDIYDFHYRWEIYTPKAARKVGPYGMPILWNGKLIGQISPLMNRETATLHIENIVVEPSFKWTPTRKKAFARALDHLAKRVGAKQVAYDCFL
jgi:uncharacterized protein